MANIFLTRKCNLKCPYCFASEFVNRENEEISLENFVLALNFIKTGNNEPVGLIGGEPTLHSKFREILEIVANDYEIKYVTLFTNGIEIDKYVDIIKNDKFYLLVNCNSPNDIGQHNYEKLKKNIVYLSKIMKDRLKLGINIYSPEMNYKYIFDLLKLTNSHFLRFSTAIPNEIKEETKDILDSFIQMKEILFSFFQDCYDNEIIPGNDCNSFPDCIYTKEEKLLLVKLAKLANELNIYQDPIRSCRKCEPVIDILTDLQAVRCFGLSKYLKMPIKNYKNIDELKSYFYNQIDMFVNNIYVSNDCKDCKTKQINKCGICLTYKIKFLK